MILILVPWLGGSARRSGGSLGRVCSVKVRSEKNGVGETARSKRMNSAFLRRRSMAIYELEIIIRRQTFDAPIENLVKTLFAPLRMRRGGGGGGGGWEVEGEGLKYESSVLSYGEES